MPLAYWFLAVIAAFGVAVYVTRRSLRLVTVVGTSMTPALQPGDRVLVLSRRLLRLRCGQVVLGTSPPLDPLDPESRRMPFLKRLHALAPAEVRVDLREVPEPFRETYRELFDATGSRVWRVAAGEVFVRADGTGLDSRIWGPVPVRDVEGVVVLRLPARAPVPDAALPPPPA